MRVVGITLLAALLLTGCARKQGSDTREFLAVSIEPQRKVLEELAGPSYSVVTMLARGADPETFDPSLSERMQLEKSCAYFATGVLPFEQTLATSTPDINFVDTSAGIDLLYGTHGHDDDDDDDDDAHHHQEADPHYWSSTGGVRVMAANMASALSTLNPDSTAVYTRRLAALTQRLDSLDNAIRQGLEAAPTKAFAIWHPSLSYYARDYGLEQISVGTEGKEMSPKKLREAIDGARSRGVKVFFFQKEYDTRQARTINDGIGSRLVTIDPLAYDWEAQLKHITDELAGS